jgi:hypothetical protein
MSSGRRSVLPGTALSTGNGIAPTVSLFSLLNRTGDRKASPHLVMRRPIGVRDVPISLNPVKRSDLDLNSFRRVFVT